MTKEIGHFIGGERVAGTSGRFGDVYNPNTGEVQAKVALASGAEMRAAVENAAAAQPAWAAKNPQVRARVFFKFLELVAREKEALAEMLSMEHGKTVPDSHGDIQRRRRGLRVCLRHPASAQGRVHRQRRTGIDMYSMRQPLGVVAGITPFNFPAMIPMWKFAPAIACGNAFILKPSERDPSVPMRLAELMIEAGLPEGVLNVVNGDKEAVDAILDDHGHPGDRLRRFDSDRRICLYPRHRERQTGAVLRRRQEPHDRHAGRGSGPGGRCADRRGLRLGRRALHGDFGRGAGRREDRRRAGRKAHSPGRVPQGGPSTDREADYGPLVTDQALKRVKGYVDMGVEEGASLRVDGRDFTMQGYESGYFMGGCLFDNVTSDMRIYKEEIFGPVLSVVRAKTYEEALDLPMKPRIRQRRRDLHPRRRHRARLLLAHQYRHGRRQRADPGAARLSHVRRLEAFHVRRSQPARPRRGPILHAHQDDHLALAVPVPRKARSS